MRVHTLICDGNWSLTITNLVWFWCIISCTFTVTLGDKCESPHFVGAWGRGTETWRLMFWACHPTASKICKIWPMPGFPVNSAGKEFACNVGDPGSIPGLGRSPAEGTGYPLQDSWASLVAQVVKNPSAMHEPWVQYLGCKDPLEEGMAAHSSILAWRIPLDRGAWRATVHGVAKSQTQLTD